MKTIGEVIHQKQFANAQVKAGINILYTASWLSADQTRLLRPFKISVQQFNVLRILRGLHPGVASLRYLAERMIDQTSNASRLVDKLVLKKLVDRKECPLDRRQVEIKITPEGLELIYAASVEMERKMKGFTLATEEELELLSSILDKIRNQ
jgi:DNA-binding MarR family transcriptional regulator